jgi:3-oxoacyl-(acyl-carrier-protein) synthase
MSAWRVAAAGMADERGVAGTGVTSVTWKQAGMDPRARIRWRSFFDEPFPDFRRLDPLSRFCCLAAEAARPADHLDEARRRDTAVVLASTLGCLHADVRFAAGLRREAEIEPAVFPYTLPSTCLGDVAIRHRLSGPTLCLAAADGDEQVGLREAARLLALEEAAAALLCVGDVFYRGAGTTGVEPRLRLAALLLLPEPPLPQDPLAPARLECGPLEVVQRHLWRQA